MSKLNKEKEPSHVLWLPLPPVASSSSSSTSSPTIFPRRTHMGTSSTSPYSSALRFFYTYGNIRNILVFLPRAFEERDGTRDVALEIDVKRQHLSTAVVGGPSYDPSPRPHFLWYLRRVQGHVLRPLRLRPRSRCRSNPRLYPFLEVVVGYAQALLAPQPLSRVRVAVFVGRSRVPRLSEGPLSSAVERKSISIHIIEG